MRKLSALSVVLLAAAVGLAEPPKLVIPAEVKPAGQYVEQLPETDAVSVQYVGLSGVDPIPSRVLNDPRLFLLDTRGLAAGSYKFAAVGSSKTGEQVRRDFAVVIGTPTTPPVTPPDKNPTDPVKPPTAGKLYFLVVRPDGPADPAFTSYMANPGWTELGKKGYLYKDKTLTEAAALGVRIPDGTAIPAVVTLRILGDGQKSEVVRGPIALPPPDSIVKLPEGVQ